MTYIPNSGGVIDAVLGTAVADDGTFTIAYPSGKVQGDYTSGLAKYGESYVILDDNDKWFEGDDPTGDPKKGFEFSFGASNVTVTNRTGASLPAGTKVSIFFNQVDGNNVLILALPMTLAKLANGDIYTGIRPGVDGYVENMEFFVTDPATTGSKLASLNAEIDGTNVTGGVVALTSANCTPLGVQVAGSQITGANRITKKSKLDIEASSVTAFVEGAGVLLVRIRLDTL